jgi:hypothetical protein
MIWIKGTPEDDQDDALRLFRYAEAKGIEIKGVPLFYELVAAAKEREKSNKKNINKLAKKRGLQIIEEEISHGKKSR